MKVKIGSYPNRLICSIYSDYMNNRYGFDWPKDQRLIESILESIEDTIQSFYDVLNWLYFDRKVQKQSIHIDRWDTWGMDHTLAPIILPMLKQLKETKHGAPNVDKEDVPESLWPNEAEESLYSKNGQTDIHFFARWDWIMDEMIWAFEQKCRDHWEEDYYGPYIGEPFEGHFEWVDDEGRMAHQARMSNGFRLFGKYYESLWD